MKIDTNSTKFLDSNTDVKHKDILTIDNEAKWQESNRWKKDDGTPTNEFRVNLKLANGEVRNTTFNWTNVKLLVDAFGDDTLTWVGKEIRAWKTKSEKAKNGFVFLFVPTTWERDDTGEWIKDDIKSDGDYSQAEPKTKQPDDIEYPEEVINAEDIPF